MDYQKTVKIPLFLNQYVDMSVSILLLSLTLTLREEGHRVKGLRYLQTSMHACRASMDAIHPWMPGLHWCHACMPAKHAYACLIIMYRYLLFIFLTSSFDSFMWAILIYLHESSSLCFTPRGHLCLRQMKFNIRLSRLIEKISLKSTNCIQINYF